MALASLAAPQEPVLPEPIPPAENLASPPAAQAPPALGAYTPRYRMLADVASLLAEWSAACPDRARVFDLLPSKDAEAVGAPLRVPAIEVARPGPVPPAERPTLLLIGGLDGASLAGGEAVLAVVRELLDEPEALGENVAVVAVPWGAPEGLTFALANDASDGRNGTPVDDDRDGRVDEDGPDDLDGDGLTLSMLLEDPRGNWAQSSDPRFLVPASAADGVRYLLCREGRDDDGDGRFNEDPTGGIVLDLNFPVGRGGSWASGLSGRLPLCDPLARAIADLALARRTVAVILFQGAHGLAAIPGGTLAGEAAGLVADADRPAFARALELFAVATGRRSRGMVALAEARGAERPGAALDWFYAVPRALALEVAVWGPEVEASAEVAPQDARFPQGSNGGAAAKGGHSGGAARAQPSEGDRAWARWLDNLHGGLGFVAWHPVELEGGSRVLVGGFEPRTIDNPPPASLPRALAGSAELVRQLAASLPRLEIRVISVARDGEVCRVRARVKNLGSLPSGLARRSGSAGGLALEFELGNGAQLIAGSERIQRERLLGGESTEEFEWVALAPEGSTFVLRATSDWTLPAAREVKP